MNQEILNATNESIAKIRKEINNKSGNLINNIITKMPSNLTLEILPTVERSKRSLNSKNVTNYEK